MRWIRGLHALCTRQPRDALHAARLTGYLHDVIQKAIASILPLIDQTMSCDDKNEDKLGFYFIFYCFLLLLLLFVVVVVLLLSR